MACCNWNKTFGWSVCGACGGGCELCHVRRADLFFLEEQYCFFCFYEWEGNGS